MSEQRIPGMTGYTLLRELGRGGMAIVYLAERFLGEARIAANHGWTSALLHGPTPAFHPF